LSLTPAIGGITASESIGSKAVERVVGKSLGDYFAEHLFGPIGMTDTVFKLQPEHRSRLVGMHARGEDGALTPIEFEIPQEPEFQMGGGGLYGTAADYLAFQQLFLNEGQAGAHQVLKRETVAMMTQNAIGDLNVRRLVTVKPAYSNNIEFFPDMVKIWGLGFMIPTESVPSGRSVGSLAWAG
jgi:methyl acetate hydrolase